MLAWFSAIASPWCWALMNVVDKLVISKKVKYPLGFAVVAGFLHLLFGAFFALSTNWTGVTLRDLIAPAVSGAILGSTFFIYYFLLKHHDASRIIGLLYFYPVLVAILSFVLLDERMKWVGYAGVILVLFGAVTLSVNMNHVKKHSLLWMVLLIILIGLYEFLIKVATNTLSEWQGMAVSSFATGIVISGGLLNQGIRKGAYWEWRNVGWAGLTEVLTLFGVFTTYIAMAGLEATIVSSVAAIQPLVVLFLEELSYHSGFKLVKDPQLRKRILPIVSIVLGVILLYVS